MQIIHCVTPVSDLKPTHTFTENIMNTTTIQNTTTTFNSRDEYIAYVAEWKKKYAELSETSRATKLELKEGQRKNDIRAIYKNTALKAANRWIATDMLAQRAAAKIEAQRQYVVEHATIA